MEKERTKLKPERKRNRHAEEFKREAVRLLELGQKPATHLALELGVRRQELYKWQAQARRSGGKAAFRSPGRPKLAESGELERLKAELKKVTEERDILKKAAAYFARQSG